MNAKLHALGHWGYVAARQAARSVGVEKPIRKLLGPIAGKFAYKVASDTGKPTIVRGHTMYLSLQGRYPPLALATDKYESETTILFETLVKPGMAVLDVGAHVGYFSLLAARGAGSTGKVYSFEPEPQNYELLLKNIEINGYKNIVSTQKAVSNKVGSTTLFLTALDNGRHSTYQHGLPETGNVAVETTTLDYFLEAEGWPDIGLVKVDVEGAEMDVLAGMGQLLDKSPDLHMILEFSPSLLINAGTDPLQFLQELADRGFEVSCIAGPGEPQPLQKVDRPSLVEKMLKSESSVNLFCTIR